MISKLLIMILLIWILSVSVVTYDLKKQNISSIMKIVWFLTVLYSGLFGVLIYYISGRNQISHDSNYRRSLRSTAHCFSGCGMGEILGIIIATIIGFSIISTGIFTFILAYLFGYLFNVIPLKIDGVSLRTAIEDSFYTESLSILVMEITAISIDLIISGGAGIMTPIFWIGLVISLIAGFIAAYPVNIALILSGVKQGMSSPKLDSLY